MAEAISSYSSVSEGAYSIFVPVIAWMRLLFVNICIGII